MVLRWFIELMPSQIIKSIEITGYFFLLESSVKKWILIQKDSAFSRRKPVSLFSSQNNSALVKEHNPIFLNNPSRIVCKHLKQHVSIVYKIWYGSRFKGSKKIMNLYNHCGNISIFATIFSILNSVLGIFVTK